MNASGWLANEPSGWLANEIFWLARNLTLLVDYKMNASGWLENYRFRLAGK